MDQTVPYLSVAEFLIDTAGIDPTDPVLTNTLKIQNMILRASSLIDTYTGIPTWGLQQVVDEVHQWKALVRPTRLRRSPVRVIMSFKILVGTSVVYGSNTLSSSWATIPTTPVGQSWAQPGDLPSQFGFIVLDRSTDTINISMTNFNTRLIALPWANGLPEPELLISYTSGFNPVTNPDGTPYSSAPDGLNIPYPNWLTQACRIIVAGLIEREKNTQTTLGGVVSGRQINVEFKMNQPKTNSTPQQIAASFIPAEALTLLTAHHRTVVL